MGLVNFLLLFFIFYANCASQYFSSFSLSIFSLILFCLFSFHRLWQLLFKNPSRHSLNFIIKCINVFYHMSFKSCSLLIFYFRYFFTCHHSIFLSLSLFSNFPLFAVYFFYILSSSSSSGSSPFSSFSSL